MGLRADLIAAAAAITTEEDAIKTTTAAKAYSLRANLDAAIKMVDDLDRILTEAAAKCPAGTTATALTTASTTTLA